MNISQFLAAYNPKELYVTLKCLLSNTFRELDLQKVEFLKAEHQEEFRGIRLEYIDLLNVARRFCENSTPLLQHSIEKLRRNVGINYRQLYQLIERIDPQPVIRRCEVLEKKIVRFSDQIKLDSDYKNIKWKSTARSIIAGICVAGTIAVAIALPLFISFEVALVTVTAVAFGATLPSLIQLFKGIAGTKLQDDVQTLLKKLNQANDDVNALKNQLSEMIEHQESVKLCLNDEDATSLLRFYEDVVKDIKEIKQICTKSVALF